MSGLFGMLFALAATLWAMPYLLVAGAFVLVVWLIRREVTRQADRELAERLAQRDLAGRMWKQHQQVMRGDPRGVYGAALPAVRKLNRVSQR